MKALQFLRSATRVAAQLAIGTVAGTVGTALVLAASKVEEKMTADQKRRVQRIALSAYEIWFSRDEDFPKDAAPSEESPPPDGSAVH